MQCWIAHKSNVSNFSRDVFITYMFLSTLSTRGLKIKGKLNVYESVLDIYAITIRIFNHVVLESVGSKIVTIILTKLKSNTNNKTIALELYMIDY